MFLLKLYFVLFWTSAPQSVFGCWKGTKKSVWRENRSLFWSKVTFLNYDGCFDSTLFLGHCFLIRILKFPNCKDNDVEESFYHTLAALCSPARIFHSHLSSTGNLSFDKILLRRTEVYWTKSCHWSLTSWFSWLFWVIVKVIKAVDVLETIVGYVAIFVLEAFVFVEMMNSNLQGTLTFAVLHLETVKETVRYNKTW